MILINEMNSCIILTRLVRKKKCEKNCECYLKVRLMDLSILNDFSIINIVVAIRQTKKKRFKKPVPDRKMRWFNMN